MGDINAYAATKKKSKQKIVQPAPKKPTTNSTNKNPNTVNQDSSGNQEISPDSKIEAVTAVPDNTPKNKKGKLMSASLVTKDPAIKTRTLIIKKGETFSKILSGLGFSQKLISDIGQKVLKESGFNIYNPAVGQKLVLTEKTENGKKKLLVIQIPTKYYNVKIYKNQSGIIQVKRENVKSPKDSTKLRYIYKGGLIQTNIENLGKSLGVPKSVMDKILKTISSKVNSSKIKKGDRLELLYAYSYDNSGVQTNVLPLYFALTSAGVRTEGFRYSSDEKEMGEFYDSNGNSFAKSILASPLKGRHKITSGFGYRVHPIFGRRLFHSGVDFGGKYREPIYASGDGTVDKIGRYGGYGNYIRIKHDNIWSTAYAHLSSYAKGIGRWSRIKKGQLIGYMGSTGNSTGTHLHFELIKNNTTIDPLKAKLPAGGKKLIGKDLYAFKQNAAKIRSTIMQLKNSQ